jgi:predicted AAA+ superfamily ATPase
MFNGKDVKGRSDLTVEGLALALLRGGWPATIGNDEAKAIGNMKDFTDALINEEIIDIDGVKRDPETMRKLLVSLSRNISTMATVTTVTKDMSGDDDTVSDKTVSDYIKVLRRLFIVEDVQAWNPSVRSGTAVRTSPKRHFVDPSIAAYMMRTSSQKLLSDLETFGLLFESLCVRDIRVYSLPLDGEVFHYRDGYGLEADIVIRLDDGRWAAAEVKMGSSDIERAAKSLLKLKDRVDAKKMGDPSFLMILTAGEYGYRRPDGIYVVPIGCLRD